ncbi:MAG: DUF2442 domain-containing protein [Spirochaetes bacterium]|nr:DUF2442 domain-containing protein [Spirochaetota bacterium]
MLHRVVQVIPKKDFNVYIYFSDGKVKLYNVSSLLNKGVFKKISNINVFINFCTVLNNTLAWDLSGQFDPYKCIDLDPEVLYQEGIEVKDPLGKVA